jgi:hypothetical protein
MHERHLVVWDVPPAIERGAAFRVRVGVKCASGCAPDAWTVVVHDHEGATRATAALGVEPWTGTSALYHAEIELTAPDADGLHTWEAVAGGVSSEGDVAGQREPGPGEPDRSEPGHSEARASFAVRSVPPPDCLVTVIAMDRQGQTPVQGATVVAHPYRALTDARGVATLRLPKGAYRLFVSGRNYVPFRRDGDITGELTIEAELEPDLPPSDAELWS